MTPFIPPCGPEFCGNERGRQEDTELNARDMGAISEGARGPLNTRSQCKLKHRPKRLLWLCLEWAHGRTTFSRVAAVRGPGSSRARCALPETPSKQVSGGCRPESWRKSQGKTGVSVRDELPPSGYHEGWQNEAMGTGSTKPWLESACACLLPNFCRGCPWLAVGSF